VTNTESGQYRRMVVAGAVLLGSAAFLGVVGLALEAGAAVSVVRRRLAEAETPPKELARRQWARYVASMRAAGEAWRAEAAAGTLNGPTGRTTAVS